MLKHAEAREEQFEQRAPRRVGCGEGAAQEHHFLP